MVEVFTGNRTGSTARLVCLVRVFAFACIGDGRAFFGQYAFTLGISYETRLTEAAVDAQINASTTGLFHVGTGLWTGTTA